MSCVSKGFNCFGAAETTRVSCDPPKLDDVDMEWIARCGDVEMSGL